MLRDEASHKTCAPYYMSPFPLLRCAWDENLSVNGDGFILERKSGVILSAVEGRHHFFTIKTR